MNRLAPILAIVLVGCATKPPQPVQPKAMAKKTLPVPLIVGPPPSVSRHIAWQYQSDLIPTVEFDVEHTLSLDPAKWSLFWRGTNLSVAINITNQCEFFRVGVHDR